MADPAPRPRPPVPADAPISVMAILAFVVAFIPFLGLFGMLFGVIAHRRITASPTPMRGGRFALAAMLIGGVTTFLSLEGLRKWQDEQNALREVALQTMFTTVFERMAADDAAGLAEQWIERPAAQPPTRAQLDAARAWLTAHAGAYRDFTLMTGTPTGRVISGAWDLTLQFRFEHGDALGAARIRLADSATPLTPEPVLYWLIVEHPEWGRIELGAVPEPDAATDASTATDDDD